jgi:hypothetical protein
MEDGFAAVHRYNDLTAVNGCWSGVSGLAEHEQEQEREQ